MTTRAAPISAVQQSLGTEPQYIDAPLTIAAAFLVLTIKDDEQSLATVRSVLGSTDDLIKNITVRDVAGFRYFDGRDLLDFADGTANPDGLALPACTIVGDEDPAHAGGSYVVIQNGPQVPGRPGRLNPYCATQPPSMFQATPRTSSAAGEHRKTARPPSCSGVTNSSEGCFSARSL